MHTHPTLILILYKATLNHLDSTHQFLAVMALGRFLEGVDKKCVGDTLTASECSVNPQGAARPHLFWPKGAIGGTIGDTVCNL